MKEKKYPRRRKKEVYFFVHDAKTKLVDLKKIEIKNYEKNLYLNNILDRGWGTKCKIPEFYLFT